jgi:hypothetical protein
MVGFCGSNQIVMGRVYVDGARADSLAVTIGPCRTNHRANPLRPLDTVNRRDNLIQ